MFKSKQEDAMTSKEGKITPVSAPHDSSKLPLNAGTLIQLGGIRYTEYLVALIEATKAERYLEIGTNKGSSLAPINCSTIAIDPKFVLSQEVIGKKELCLFFQMTSDKFFEKYSASKLLGGLVDVAFLDGLHLFEYLLRDFIGAEKHCKKGSLIIMHDCIPPTFEMTNRDVKPAKLNPNYLNYWTGDVWKICLILKKFRPDLSISYLDCPPTGLVVVSNCDAQSTILQDEYHRIVDSFAQSDQDLKDLQDFTSKIDLVKTKQLSAKAFLAGL